MLGKSEKSRPANDQEMTTESAGKQDGIQALPVLLRAATPADWPFVADSWYASWAGPKVATGKGYAWDMKWLIRSLLGKAAVLVAVDEESGAIWGWAATVDSTVLYVYVREGFRGRGLAKLLLAPFLGRPCTYIARSSHPLPIPREWRFSFIAAIRLLAEGDNTT